MEGLEISEVMLSEVGNFNDKFRIDAEFFQKEYLRIETLLMQKSFKRLCDTDCKILHPAEIKRIFVDENNGIWFFRTQNIRPLKINQSNDVFISFKDAEKLSKNKIKKYDIVITRTGANYGQTAIYNYDKIAIGSSHTFIVRNSYFNQFYLAVFFNTNYGKALIDKGVYGGLQPEIAPYYLSNIPIPDLSKDFQNEIELCLKKSEELIEQSKSLYTQAEEVLLHELGLNDFTPSQNNINIKNLSESFAVSGRLDAEYYQEKYEDYEKLIKDYPYGYDNLSNVCILKDENCKPQEAQEYKYIELSNVGSFGDINGYILDLGDNLPSRARRLVKKDDVIISSIEGSLNSCAIVAEKYNNSLCSTGFYVIKSKKINSATLLILFKSKVLQNVLKQKCSGTILTAINKDEFLDIPLPLVKNQTQTKIANLIEKSFSLKSGSEELLAQAKKAVEIAIEKGEDEAVRSLKV